MYFKYFCLLFFLGSCLSGFTQNKVLQVVVKDNQGNTLQDVWVVAKNQSQEFSNLTNQNGQVSFILQEATYALELSHLSYTPQSQEVVLDQNQVMNVVLLPQNNVMSEVVITAQEGKGLSTSSIISKKAMQHLQPSSFADLMELLPGGKATGVNLTSTNRILIREFGQGQNDGDYTTSSLGVQFVMDGNLYNTNADMQVSVLTGNNDAIIGSGVSNKRNTSFSGVDMRGISTNDINKVEVIRGIPDASYGDLSSGVVIIDRVSGFSPYRARMKVDGFSKQFYLGKGADITPSWSMNFSGDILDAKSDPREFFENFKRITASVRSQKVFTITGMPLTYKSSLDYSSVLDNNRFDPESGYAAVDYYKNNRHRIAFSNNFEIPFLEHHLLKYVKFNTSIIQSIEDLDQRKFVQNSGPRAISIATSQGVNKGYFPSMSYVSDFKVHGRPLDINLKLLSALDFQLGGMTHLTSFGVEFKYAKNNGNGKVYDLLTPPSATLNTRPVRFKDIPGYSNLAFFLGDQVSYSYLQHDFSLYVGVRVNKFLGMDKSYSISNKVFVEPRINFSWSLPTLPIGSNVLKTDITLGLGQLYKHPTLLMLYPDPVYLDFQQLSFYPSDENLQSSSFMTCVQDVTNKNLASAKNTKRELRVDLSYSGFNFFITYFQENMPNGFRQMRRYKTYGYKRYDTSDLDPDSMQEFPDLEEIPFEHRQVFSGVTTTKNGSRTNKTGIEFGLSSKRIEPIKTKFTLSGAWFKTIYANSDVVYEKPTVSLDVPYPYIGIYSSDLGFKNQGLNYNLVVDTYLQSLDMNISASFQGSWFYIKSNDFREQDPLAYMDLQGDIHPFTLEDKTDLYKQWLVRNVSPSDNMQTKYTFDITMNLKVSKRVFEDLNVSFFVNNLVSHFKPYYFNNTKVERKNMVDPYFGIELNYNF